MLDAKRRSAKDIVTRASQSDRETAIARVSALFVAPPSLQQDIDQWPEIWVSFVATAIEHLHERACAA